MNKFIITEPAKFRQQLLQYLQKQEVFAVLDSNNFYQAHTDDRPYYHSYDLLVGIGQKRQLKLTAGDAFRQLKKFWTERPCWLMGYLSYDLKQETDGEKSPNKNYLQLPDLFFFEPEYVLELNGHNLTLRCEQNDMAENLMREIENVVESLTKTIKNNSRLKSRVSKEEYLADVEAIRQHIIEGDVYELNYCQEFYSENAALDPFELYRELCLHSPQPFSAFIKQEDTYILSASMERYLKKTGNKVISQPIKGTIRRGESAVEDRLLADELLNDPKERAENVMIVDLVRNDLSRCCVPGSVKVEELFGIYPFPQVHHMISTISGTLNEGRDMWDILRNSFPMGSMTGAPKEMAMQLIDTYEKSRRGIYSGALGYITPGGDLDMSVVIRTLIYNAQAQLLSLYVGSAITFDSIPEKEYEECLVKIKGLIQVLNTKIEA